MTEAARTVGPDDDPTMADLADWHATDRPDCSCWVLQMGLPGFRCVACDWWVAVPDDEILTETDSGRRIDRCTGTAASAPTE